MIDETLQRIEDRLRASLGVEETSRSELLDLLARLKTEVSALSQTRADDAERIAGFAAVSAHEAMRPERNDRILGLSIDGLSSSVDGFESSHPQLVKTVNAICSMLSDLGI